MRAASPLRYPGGKSVLANLLGKFKTLNNLNKHSIAEPYAGGGGASLTLLYLEYAKDIFVNDADSGIFAFWWSITRHSERFVNTIDSIEVTLEEWYRQRDIYRRNSGVPRFSRGFATFFLNRCNRSGIIVNGGPIGGLEQKGKWRIDARFNKEDLKRRCAKVAEYKERIVTSNCDGIKFIGSIDEDNTLYFIDPPYFENGANLYLDVPDKKYHNSLAEKLYEMQDKAWVLTYDNCSEIQAMYGSWSKIRPYWLDYTTRGRREGAEVLIVPKWMRLPEVQESGAIRW